MTKPKTKSAEAFFPKKMNLNNLRKAVAACTACPLYKIGTQAVFGEGPESASVMMVGEQPGHEEDLAGRPFVGPAGKRLDAALQEAGLSRNSIYITNVVKHFKWKPKGNRRIGEKPNQKEIAACFPWLKAELELCKPKILVCLGVTAAQAILGRKVTIKQKRGRFFSTSWAPFTYVTVHPASLLRHPDPEERRRAFREFVDDLKKIAEFKNGELNQERSIDRFFVKRDILSKNT